MMFSTKAEYGVRVMAHLARSASEASGREGKAQAGDDPISLSSIAEAEGLPLAYLEHLVQRLRRAGLVESRRGAHGGYSLAQRAESISMAEVVQALEGEIAPIECITSGADGSLVCAREGKPGHDPCATKLLWTRVQGSIVRTLGEMTLADLVRPYENKKEKGRRQADRSREAGGREFKSDRGAGGPAEVTIT
jgi:Rrf2 family transcriptional regulator, cysteine metabolism repressor